MSSFCPEFCILEFPPRKNREMWTYATCGMTVAGEVSGVELHVFSAIQDESLAELLTATAHYHLTSHRVGLADTINFGRSWRENSTCQYGLISLPYLDGSSLENLNGSTGTVRFLWVIPITKQELDHKKKFGVESLEQLFETQHVDYLDPSRESVVK